ncbi:GNAT family N-acetyltransferase [Actinoplanes aureus]|uniref:GNAT family N-acetyltransferase n=1 Tax=Actinoplanes aureus TaxID=2792083 RepID=A0A931CI98_9ACTN|nr:GNAT family N-acetyltransferase [Actinoplanes aureus]MBG0567636.1 GNAT family N-acetyltransferase [Actinoplanes aureus]
MAEVRAARDEDVEAICDICARAYHATYAGLVSSDYLNRMLDEFYRPERVGKAIAATPPDWLGYQVAEHDGRVLGFAAGGITTAGAGELFTLYLEPGERGRGLGTLLLDRITEQLREQGATEMWVAALAGNELAVPFYRARGFVKEGERPAYGTTGAEDYRSWLLRRPI